MAGVAIPQEKFEEALRDPVLRPTTAGIIARAAEPKKISPADPRALWIWGRLKDFEREGILKEDPRQIGALIKGTMCP
jgi:hypothetical protein